MKLGLAVVLLMALTLLCGCGYLPVEEEPVQVGDAVVVVTQAPKPEGQ